MNKYQMMLRNYFIGNADEYIGGRQLLCGILSFSNSVSDPAQVAERLLSKYPALDSLLCLSCEEIADDCGLDLNTAFLLKLIAEASSRRRIQAGIGAVLDSPKAACRFFENTYRGAIVEEFRVACLDNKLKVVDYGVIARGNLTEVTFDKDALLRKVKSSGCSQCIIAHNHPGVSNMPSDADLAVTNKLIRYLDEIGAKLIEHIIIGDDGAGCVLNRSVQYCFL